MGRTILDTKQVAERKLYRFPFTLPVGVTISSALTGASVYSGLDASPGNIVDGAAAPNGSFVEQSFIGGVSGVLYDVVCTATLSTGKILQAVGVLVII